MDFAAIFLFNLKNFSLREEHLSLYILSFYLLQSFKL